MTRLLLALALAVGLVGCTSLEPAGPFAKKGVKSSQGKELESNLPPQPVTVPPVKPTPPVNWVDPSDVALDPYAASEKLAGELEADQKTIPTPSRTAEISVIKGGVKQQ
jgi:hypothetical protein